MGKPLHTRFGHRPTIDGRASRLYDVGAKWLMRTVYRRIADDIVEVAPDGALVLDVGTGPGWLLVEIAERRADLGLTGVDLSADMVAAAQRNLDGRAAVQIGDAADLPFSDQSFDLIVSSFSLHHWDDPAAAAPELARVLRPGGRLFIYDFRPAPFDALDRAARAASLFTGRPVQRTRINTGALLIRRCVRHVMTV